MKRSGRTGSIDRRLRSGGCHAIRAASAAAIVLGAALMHPAAAQVPYERLVAADSEPESWLTYSGNYAGHRFSRLDQINAGNVADLRVVWAYQMDDGLIETSPVVADGVMYVTEPPSTVSALDARTGKRLWTWSPEMGSNVLNIGFPRVNRGVAILDSTLYVGTLDAHLVALDARSGAVRWDVVVADNAIGFSLTLAPLALDGKVIVGVSGAEAGVRGFIDAYDPETGDLLWRTYTIPAPGEPGSETWGGNSWETGGGSTWLTGSYDPELDLLYWPIGNPAPDWNGDVRPGDNLYTDCLLALDPDTGEIVWYFQFTPHDTHDWDANQIQVLVDAEWEGEPRKLVVTANRNAFYYVLDRETGEFLHGTPYSRQTWAEGLDENGRPIVIPGTDPTEEGNLVWPSLQGSANWFSPSYSPMAGLFYQPTRIMGAIYYKAEVEYEPGQPFMGGGEQALQGEEASGAIKALDVLTGELKWEFPLQSPPWAGVMATAGNLVFGGSDEGNIFALNAETGEPLWNFQAGAAVRSAPMSFEIDGQQRIVNSAGGTMFVFGLGPESDNGHESDNGPAGDNGHGSATARAAPPSDPEMLARIREEGLHRSQLPRTLSYMTDVIGARLTNSAAMDRAQQWAVGEMERIGLVNTEREPFMNYGASWDNAYVSVHMTAPDYQPLVAYPIAHTPGTNGKQQLDVVIADVRTRGDLEGLRGRLRGLAVMSTPPPVFDLTRFATGTPRRTDEEMRALEEDVIPPPPGPDPYFSRLYPDPPANPDVLTAAERLAFYVKEGVALVLESNSGWLGAVRGFARPGAKVDRWDRDVTLASVPIVAVTPEHYNRMYRILRRDIPVTVEVEVRNVHGGAASEASNVLGEIPGSDLAHEVVMLGAHFDTWHASPNASDNTSGVAVMLEAVRILKAVGVAPRRTIRVALWSGEEQGIFGSTAYVQKHFGSPGDPGGVKPAYDDFSVYFNQDYGPGQYRGIWLQQNEYVRDLFATWMEPLRDLGMTTISPRSVGSTDHMPFDRAGLPAFQFLQARVGGTGGHTNLDFYDTLPIDDLVKNAVIMASFVYNAAMAEQKVPRKGPR